MSNTVYNNFVLSNEVEDQFNSHLDLQQFCTIDSSLVGTAGMKRTIHKYSATNGTEKLAEGVGNSETIGVSYIGKDYEVLLAQNRFAYYDEQEMKDPMLVPTGTKHMGTDMFNTVNADVFAEFNKASKVVVVTGTNKFGFDVFADAQSMLNLEDLEGVSVFALVNASDVAEIRKELKTSLQYVEAFAKSGYVGTCAGVNIYTKKDAVTGTICFATKEAVTLFVKKGTEIEQEREPNTRENTIYSRKYYIPALTDERKAVKVVKGSVAETSDETTVKDKVYYKADGLGYVQYIDTVGGATISGLDFTLYEITATAF